MCTVHKLLFDKTRFYYGAHRARVSPVLLNIVATPSPTYTTAKNIINPRNILSVLSIATNKIKKILNEFNNTSANYRGKHILQPSLLIGVVR